jgi:hypothetical protein
MRWLAALAVVGCSAQPRVPEPTRPTTPAPLPPGSGSPAPVPTLHERRDVIEGPHAGRIVTLGMTPDGKSVLSVDELGGTRLWLALDGSIEPRIVAMPTAKQVALGNTPDGFVAIALDEVGGLYIARLDATGRQLSHATLPAEPAVTGMAMSAVGLVARRADQTVVLLDANGAIKAKLGTEPQHRIVALAVSGKRAVAVLDKATVRQVRWLELEPTLAWGAPIKLAADLSAAIDIALSPNAKRLVIHVMGETLGSGQLFDIASGKALASGTYNSQSATVAFVDDDHAVIGGSDGVSWIDVVPKSPPPIKVVLARPVAPVALAAGGGHAVTPMNGDLVIQKPGVQKFLGYETVAPRIAEGGPGGHVLVGVGDHMLLLDQNLRAAPATSTFDAITGNVAELRWVGGDDWLLQTTNHNDGALMMMLVSSKDTPAKVRTGIKETQIIDYEPSTDLVTLSFGAETEVARLDRKGRKLDRLAARKKGSPYEQVLLVPVSPALAGGIQLVQITMKERSTIKWLRDPAALDKASATVTVDGPFAGADAAGNVYMWRNTPRGQLELVVYADGKPVRTLPNTGALALWPEPSGKRYLELAQSTVAMYDAGGKQLWFQQLATSQEALWLSDGALAITSASGIARLDPATGAVTAARCGWRFGLADKPHPATPTVEPLCSQLQR